MFVIVLGLFAAVFVMCVVAVVKECVRRRRRDPVSEEPPQCAEMGPVDWFPAVVVANPDNTQVWGAVKA